ncbi:MAG: DUF1573 domain-containing protein [Cytophagaceae bacterium]|jgi:hypothetical protein|nr:DUF1573 domain-containing protein [Cytophagaceae bacterium]
MTRTLILFLLGYLFSVALNAQTSGPQFQFEKRIHDFGEVIQGQTVSYTFVFTNSGTDTLVISRVIPSCGCTVADTFTKVIPPGQKGEILVQFNSTGRVGIITKSLTILSNIEATEPMTIAIKINVLLPKP